MTHVRAFVKALEASRDLGFNIRHLAKARECTAETETVHPGVFVPLFF